MTTVYRERAAAVAHDLGISDMITEVVDAIEALCIQVHNEAVEKCIAMCTGEVGTYNGTAYDGGSGSNGFDRACYQIEEGITALIITKE